MIDALAPLQPFEESSDFIWTIGAREQREQATVHFLGRVAVEILGALVPTGDVTFEIVADDGIVAGFDDGGEMQAGLHGTATFADIAEDENDAGDRPAFAADGRGR